MVLHRHSNLLIGCSGCRSRALQAAAHQGYGTFRGTAHSKDDSYPELSHHKSAADRWQLRSVRPHCPHTHASSTVMLIAVLCLSHATGGGRGRPAFHSAGFLSMTSHLLRCARCKVAFCAPGGRRDFHWVPNHGATAINRQISGCNRLGNIDMDQEATLLQECWAPRLLGNSGAQLPSIPGWMQ